MQIDFWFDPACPWCWLTSRWLNDTVAPERDLEINWRPISLLLKNSPSPDDPYFGPLSHTHKLLRVFLAIKHDSELENAAQAAARFYTEAGIEIHQKQNLEVTAEQILANSDLGEHYAKAYDDETFDSEILSEMDAGLDLVGSDVGTPIIAFDTPSGRKGIFGPVMSHFPSAETGDIDKALEIWDSIISLASMDHFWELKRTRTEQTQVSK